MAEVVFSLIGRVSPRSYMAAGAEEVAKAKVANRWSR